MIQRNVPLCFLMVIIYWYVGMYYECKWGMAKSDSFKVKCGTKQGGILSPDFFSLYIDDLIKILRQKRVGCHITNLFIACILFADDMTLLAPTRDAMQEMLNVCARYCSDYCLKFNVEKTKIMIFGKACTSVSSLACVELDGKEIEFVYKCKYLGFYVVSSTNFKLSFQEDLCGFFGSVNSVLTGMTRPKENVLLQLLYRNCIPRLTYGAAVKDPTAAEKHRLNVSVNNAIRRIFGFKRWESIRYLREFYRLDSIEVMFAKARARFETGIANHRNYTLRFLSTLNSLE